MDKKRVSNILEKCKGKTIAVVGDLMLDSYIWGKVSRISPEAPVPIVEVKKVTYALGGATNVMKNIVSLGAKVKAFGVIGKNEISQKLLKLMEYNGINTKNVSIINNYLSIEKQRIIAESQQLIRIDYQHLDFIPQIIQENIVKSLINLIKNNQIDAIIFEDYAKNLITSEMITIVNNEARKRGIITALDPHPTHNLNFDHITLITPNKFEACIMAGIYNRDISSVCNEDKDILNIALKIQKKWNVEQLLITCGKKGVFLFENKNPFIHISTKVKKVFDVTGAGDTVIASYTLSLIGGALAEEAAIISNAAAGIVIGRIGTSSVSPEELSSKFN